MYTCSICKQSFEGEPKRVSGRNGNVLSCADCVSASVTASQKARQERLENIASRNQCVWCDEPLTVKNRADKKDEEYNVNQCVDCVSSSAARQQLKKWVKAVGPDPHKGLFENVFWRYLDGTSDGQPRKKRWESERQAKIMAAQEIQKEQQNNTPDIDPEELAVYISKFLTFQKWLQSTDMDAAEWAVLISDLRIFQNSIK